MMLNGDHHKQVVAAEAGDAKAVHKCMLALIEGRGRLHEGVSKEQFADNLVEIIEEKFAPARTLETLDTAKFRLVLINDPHERSHWRLVLLHGKTVILKGEQDADAQNCLKGLLNASGQYIHTCIYG